MILRTCPETPSMPGMFWLVALSLCASGIPAEEVNPGLKVQVTQKGLEFGRQLAIQVVQSLHKTQFPDLEGSYAVPLIGNVRYSISNIQLYKLQVDNSNVGFSKGSGVNLNIQDGQIGLSGNWKLAASLGGTSGTANISVRKLSLSASVGIGRGDGGRPHLWYESCRSTIEDIDIKSSGRTGWLYNMVASLFKKSLRSEVNKHVCSEFKKGSAIAEKYMSTMNVSLWVDSIAQLNCSIVNHPKISTDSCNVDLKGEFFRKGQRRGNPFMADPFHLPEQPDSMMLLGVSEFVANSAAFVYFTAGALQANFTDNMIPQNFPFRLSTKNIGLLLPELKKQFPDLPMTLNITARKPPVLSFHPGGVDVKLFASAEAFVVLPNSSLFSVFQLNIDCNLTGQVLLEPDQLGNSLGRAGASLALKDVHLWKHQSSISNIKTVSLENMLKDVLRLALAKAKQPLKKGIALPNLYNSTLVHPKITMLQGFMLIASDLKLPPQKSL